MDWTNLTVSESVEEREVEMSSLVAGFTMRMHKRDASAQEETTPDLKVPSDKRSRLFGLDEEVQDDLAVITVDSSEQVLEVEPAIGGATQDASQKACAALEDETPVGELPHVDEASVEASLFEATGASPHRAKWASLDVHGARKLLNSLVLS